MLGFSRHDVFQWATQFLGELSAKSLSDATARHRREFCGKHRGKGDRCFCRSHRNDTLKRNAGRWSWRKTGVLRGSRKFIRDSCRAGWQFVVERAGGSPTPRLSPVTAVPVVIGRLRAHGLVEVGAEGRLFMWRGGSPDVSLMRTNFKQLRGDLLDANYITDQEFDQGSARLDDPEFMTPSPIMWTAWGRRPTAQNNR